MITKEKLKIFDKYEGDIDWIYRVNDHHAKEIFNDENNHENDDWASISLLMQDVLLIENNLVSPEYKAQSLRKIEISVDPDAINLLYSLSKKQSINYLNKLKPSFLNRVKNFFKSE